MQSMDFAAAVDATDLRGLIESDLGPPHQNGRFVCPFHAGAEKPNLAISPDGKHWKCWTGRCGRHGDAIDWVALQHGVSKTEAARRLSGSTLSSRSVSPPPIRRKRPNFSRRRLTKEEVNQVVSEAVDRLWSEEGVDEREYLRNRGLEDQTIQRAKLGWIADDHRIPWRASGIIIPWFEEERLTCLKLRSCERWLASFSGDRCPPKYIEAFREDPGLFLATPIKPGRPVIIVEGELDALLVAQVLQERATVATVGAATSRVDPSVLFPLIVGSPWLIATDNDEAGDKLASKLIEIGASRSQRVSPPAKDWTDTHAHGWGRIAYYFGKYLPSNLSEDFFGQTWGPANLPEGDPTLDEDEPHGLLAGS